MVSMTKRKRRSDPPMAELKLVVLALLHFAREERIPSLAKVKSAIKKLEQWEDLQKPRQKM